MKRWHTLEWIKRGLVFKHKGFEITIELVLFPYKFIHLFGSFVALMDGFAYRRNRVKTSTFKETKTLLV